MGQQHHVLMLSTVAGLDPLGKPGCLADAKPCRDAGTGNSFFAASMRRNLIDFLLGEKVARISLPCRRSHSQCRNFQLSRQVLLPFGGGASDLSSRRLLAPAPGSVERPTPRSRAISLRPTTHLNRTASAANSFPNRRCGLPMKCSFPSEELSTFPRQVHADRNRSRAECEPTSPRHAGFSSLVSARFLCNVANGVANQSEGLKERMHLSGEGLIIILVVGIIAGWLAGKVVQGS